MSYYHRYRPQQFSELYGQETVRLILGQALLADRVGHAYLFSGSRGTGKTTTARLLAKAVNCLHRPSIDDKPSFEPCNECELCLSIGKGDCLDVVEIDAASNRGIDEIRELQEQVRFRPQQGSKKVCIIDEVHMLTKEAFNALLKTLEEPPSYLIFILATTELHKVPATVISRCQRFDFRTPRAEAIGEYLAMIASKENFSIEPQAIAALAELARGSFRDASTLLEQLVQEKQVTLAIVKQTFGLPQDNLLNRYLDAVSGNNDPVLLSDMQDYFNQGGNASAFLDLLFDTLASRLASSQLSDTPSAILTKLVRAKYQMKYSSVATLPLLTLISQTTDIPMVKSVSVDEVSDISDETIQEKTELVTISVAEQITPANLPQTKLTAMWQKTLDALIQAGESSLVAILRTAQPLLYEQPVLTIGVQFKFHADHLAKQKNRAILEAVLTELIGHSVRIESKVQPDADLTTTAKELFS